MGGAFQGKLPEMEPTPHLLSLPLNRLSPQPVAREPAGSGPFPPWKHLPRGEELWEHREEEASGPAWWLAPEVPRLRPQLCRQPRSPELGLLLCPKCWARVCRSQGTRLPVSSRSLQPRRELTPGLSSNPVNLNFLTKLQPDVTQCSLNSHPLLGS